MLYIDGKLVKKSNLTYNMLRNISLLWSLKYQLSLIAGLKVLSGDGIRLVCPHGLVTPMYWTFGHQPSYRHSQIVNSTIVEEPWNSRGWNVDMTSDDLIILEVKLWDEGAYDCGNNANRSWVILYVHCELSYWYISIIRDGYRLSISIISMVYNWIVVFQDAEVQIWSNGYP